MRRIMSALAGAALACAGIAPAATAEAPCQSRASVARILEQQYHERWVAFGATVSDWRIEFWARPGGGSWTLIATKRIGRSEVACFLAAGVDWQAAPGVPVDRR
jgi:hypothetical protein